MTSAKSSGKVRSVHHERTEATRANTTASSIAAHSTVSARDSTMGPNGKLCPWTRKAATPRTIAAPARAKVATDTTKRVTTRLEREIGSVSMYAAHFHL